MFGRAAPPPDGLIETDPIMWLLWRRNRFPRPDRFFLLTILTIGLPMTIAGFCGPLWWCPVLAMVFVLHIIAVSHMASQACKRIANEDDRAALEVLTTTPRAARGTLKSYHQAFKQLFKTQFWWLVGLHTVLIFGALTASSPLWALWPAVALIVLFAERFAISWVGLNRSLRHARYHRALGGVQLGVMLPVWGYLVVLVAMFPLRILHQRHWWVGYAGWMLVGGLLPLVAGLWNRAQAERWMRDHGSLYSTQ